MKQSITTLVVCLFFYSGLFSQGQIGLSFYLQADLYTVEDISGIKVFDSGLENLKHRNVHNNIAMDLSYAYKLKANQSLRADLLIAPFYTGYCYSDSLGSTCGYSGFDVPINIKLAYLKSFKILKKANLFVGSGLGTRFFLNPGYNDTNRNLTGGGSGTSSSSINGIVVQEISETHLEYTNRFSLYLPVYIGLEFQLTESIAFFYEAQAHVNLFKEMAYADFEITSSNFPGETIESRISYGNNLLRGVGFRYTLPVEKDLKSFYN